MRRHSPIRRRHKTFATAALLLLAAHGGAALAQEDCATPLAVTIVDVRSAGEDVLLQVSDPTPAGIVDGYNVYRSADPRLPRDAWETAVVGATDEDAAAPNVQITATPAGDLTYWFVAALDEDCAAEGPRGVSSQGDVDGDGVGAMHDACPTSPRGAEPVLAGCSASDLLLRPDVLTAPTREGLARFRAVNDETGYTVPFSVMRETDLADVELATAADAFRGVTPCDGAAALGQAVLRVGNTLDAIAAHVESLGGVAAAVPGHAPLGVAAGTEGPYDWPSAEVLHWEGQQFALAEVLDEAMDLAAAGQQVCDAQGPVDTVGGRIVSLSDDGRLVTLASGEQVVMSWTATAATPEDALATDIDVGLEATTFGGVQVATYFDKLSPDFTYVPGPTLDQCLQLRVVPVQPWAPPSGLIRHPLDGYQEPGGRLELEAGMRLMADGPTCPGVIEGGGPGGEDLRIDYFIELKLSYFPPEGAYVANAPLSYDLAPGAVASFPEMKATSDAVLTINRMKRSCLDSGVSLPVIDPYSGTVVGETPVWNCSAPQLIETTQPTLRMREGQSYCETTLSPTLLTLEDHQPQTWQAVQVLSADPLQGVPGPVTFSSVGDQVIAGNPLHGLTISVGEQFAVYSRFGHAHEGLGTNRRSGLDWPRITGTRNGAPYRYTCAVPRVVRDLIQTCGGGTSNHTYYRLPYPSGVDVTVGQGNGGTFSHSGWQFFAFDLSGGEGDPLRAARGGTVVSVRKDATINCMTGTCTNWGFPDLDGYGNHVAIQHDDGVVTWYAHMVTDSPTVFVGQVVGRGAHIGDLGNTGNSTGPHLHIHETLEDPATWLSLTDPMRFEAENPSTSNVQTCLIPQEDEDWVSTNLP